MWQRSKGLEALNLKWDAGENGDVTLETIISTMDRASRNPGVVATKVGDAAARSTALLCSFRRSINRVSLTFTDGTAELHIAYPPG